MQQEALRGRPISFTSWNGYRSNIEQLARAAPMAGFFNPIVDADGVVRSIPLLAEYKGQYYEALSLAMFRMRSACRRSSRGFRASASGRNYQGLESIVLRHGQRALASRWTKLRRSCPSAARAAQAAAPSATSPLRPAGQAPAAGSLKDKIVLVGPRRPGLQDLRVTPVGETYPGVETHANVISGLLDGRFRSPDYAIGYEVVILLLAGLTLAFALPLLSATRAVLVSVACSRR